MGLLQTFINVSIGFAIGSFITGNWEGFSFALMGAFAFAICYPSISRKYRKPKDAS